jgi:hypothetical protein
LGRRWIWQTYPLVEVGINGTVNGQISATNPWGGGGFGRRIRSSKIAAVKVVGVDGTVNGHISAIKL